MNNQLCYSLLFPQNVSDNTAYLNAVSFSLLYPFSGELKTLHHAD